MTRKSSHHPENVRVAGAGQIQAWRGVSRCVAQTLTLGQTIGRLASPGDLVALTGDLGAGKTQLVRGLAIGLGIDPAAVSSPTFVVMQRYAHPSGQPVLLHVDAYRLEHADDAASMGWDTDLFDEAVVVVEWADRLVGRLPVDRLEIQMIHRALLQRALEVTAHGSWCPRMQRVCGALTRAIAGADGPGGDGEDHHG